MDASRRRASTSASSRTTRGPTTGRRARRCRAAMKTLGFKPRQDATAAGDKALGLARMLPVRSRQRGEPRTDFRGAPMAARSIASLSLSFGLVSIPVKLYSATESSAHRALQPARQGRLARSSSSTCPRRTRHVVERAEMVKGYEFEKDRFVHLPARRAEGAAGEPEPHDRHRRLHPREGGRPDLLRQGLLPRARQARRQALQPADARPCARAAAARSPSGPGRASSTSCRCGRPKTAWCCSSCSTPTKCAR